MIQINLLPWREWQQHNHQQRFKALLLGAAMVCAAGVYGVVNYIGTQKNVQEQRNAAFQQEIRMLDYRLAKVPALNQQRSELLRRVEVINNIQLQRNQVTALLNLFPELVPEGVYLEQLSVNGARIELRGQADGNAQLARFLANGESHPNMRNLIMHSIITEQQTAASQRIAFRSSFEWVNTVQGEQ
ncbi:PilN domain-containing protein [Thaumasiovibrio subtropicus]|uniref:PilN domain-containing protein n=1 Tax=Thaumasiovibrio subtropicus TaxID=1891207 RepID=UPI000B364307|nr:PilN domain-containing protein [Thaumasiovibrio subtropicus]